MSNSNRPTAAERRLVAAIVVVFAAEAVFLAWVVHERGLFEYIGLDYRGSRTAGEAILEHGREAAYDLPLLEDSRRQLYDRYVIESRRLSLPFGVVPAPYPPPFTLAFIPSTFLEPVPGFLSWTTFHALLLAISLLRLSRAFGVSRPGWLIVAVVLSFPAFINRIMGQISVWLVVFFGEVLIAFERGKPFRTGLWLGLMVFRPQVLVVIVPALALARQWRVLGGMAALAAAVIGPTFLVAGGWTAGFLDGVMSTAGSTDLVMTTFPSSMTNWRAFALNAARFHHPRLVTGAAMAAMLATGIAGLACFRGLRSADRRDSRVAWLGIAAATCAFSWHAHVHQTLVLLPPLFAAIAVRPRLKEPAAFAFLATSGLYLLVTFTLGFAVGHDILGLVLLAMLVALTAV